MGRENSVDWFLYASRSSGPAVEFLMFDSDEEERNAWSGAEVLRGVETSSECEDIFTIIF